MTPRVRALRVDHPGITTYFLPLPAEPTREVRFNLDDDWDGTWSLNSDVSGARVKPVVSVPEGSAEAVDRAALRKLILDAGAVYCKQPEVHVRRREVRRDARHDVELSLEDSLRIFAEETQPRDAERFVKFAAAIAREADSGETE